MRRERHQEVWLGQTGGREGEMDPPLSLGPKATAFFTEPDWSLKARQCSCQIAHVHTPALTLAPTSSFSVSRYVLL